MSEKIKWFIVVIVLVIALLCLKIFYLNLEVKECNKSFLELQQIYMKDKHE